MENVRVFNNGVIDTLDKPYSVCWMVFGPNDYCNVIAGETEKVKKYWGNLEFGFDFNWFVFDSKDEMEEGIKKITSEPTSYMTWMLFSVEDCKIGEYPNVKYGLDLGNPVYC